MNKEPKQILIKVMCSERLPSEEGYYLTEKGTMLFSERNGCFVDDISCWAGVTYWYEPATSVVLTVEEWEEIKQEFIAEGYKKGYIDGALPRIKY